MARCDFMARFYCRATGFIRSCSGLQIQARAMLVPSVPAANNAPSRRWSQA